MSNHEVVNKADHRHVKINRGTSLELVGQQFFSVTFPWEFRSLQGEYPIFFRHDAELNTLLPIALHGFESGSNLFVQDGKWRANYLPLMVQRQPFLIGQQAVEENGESKQQRVVLLDTQSPRVNNEDGEALFDEHGGQSQYLQQVADMLETIHHGLNDAKRFVAKLGELNLIEPVTLSITLADGNKHEMIGLHTINEDRLDDLDDDTLKDLYKSKDLAAIYYICASHSHVKRLIELKNQQLV